MRLIDTDALLKVLENTEEDVIDDYGGRVVFGYSMKQIKSAIEKVPTADAAPVVHGRWEDYGLFNMCPKCKMSFVKVHFNGDPTFYYCPNCGAKMKDEADEAN